MITLGTENYLISLFFYDELFCLKDAVAIVPFVNVRYHPEQLLPSRPIEFRVTGELSSHSVTFCNFCDYFNCAL